MQSRIAVSGSWVVRLASVIAVAAIAMMIVAGVGLVSPRPAYADHNSMYLVCPDPIPEGNSDEMLMRRSGYKIKKAFFFTDHRYYTADSNDFQEYHGFKVENDDRTLSVPVVTKEDTIPEHDETFAIGYWEDYVWHYCVITIEDDDAPEILNVEIGSRPVDGYAYRAGEGINITVELDQKVDVDGTPIMALFLGDGDGSAWRGATYLSGSGSRSLVFRYTVQPEDFDSDGISVGAAAVDDDRKPAYGFSGNIYAKGTDVPIDYSHPGLDGAWKQKVDGRPYVQSARITSSPGDGWDAYRANQIIEVSMTFDADVVVEGEVYMDIYLEYTKPDWVQITRQANYLRGSGTDTLVFGYTVQPGDTSHEGVGITMGTESYGFGGSGTIKAKGTDVERNPWYRGTGNQPGHKVDTSTPAVSTVRITSQPANGEAYAAGEIITMEVAFDESVTVSGNPQLETDVGGVARQATFQSPRGGVYGSSLVFHYTVQEGDEDTDGIGIGANRLRLNGGGIHDSAGNAAGLSHGAVASESGQRVATST